MGCWARQLNAQLVGGQFIYYPGFWEAVTNYSICSTLLFPKQTKAQTADPAGI